MVDRMQQDFSIDPDRVFVTGHSAGAAMSLVMLATWPDVFAAGASIAGIPFRCPDTYNDVYTCMTPGIDRAPGEWAKRARRGYPGYGGPWPRVSVWHGTADYTVGINNLGETVEQWTALHGADAAADAEDEVDGYPHKVYRDGERAVVESYEITGAGHATFVRPDEGCGSVGAFFEDRGICSSLRIAQFFGIADRQQAEGGGDSDGDVDDGEPGPGPDGSCECDCGDAGCAVAPETPQKPWLPVVLVLLIVLRSSARKA
jgi:poly(3-hydroxybutyrate) depolymerase